MYNGGVTIHKWCYPPTSAKTPHPPFDSDRKKAVHFFYRKIV